MWMESELKSHLWAIDGWKSLWVLEYAGAKWCQVPQILRHRVAEVSSTATDDIDKRRRQLYDIGADLMAGHDVRLGQKDRGKQIFLAPIGTAPDFTPLNSRCSGSK